MENQSHYGSNSGSGSLSDLANSIIFGLYNENIKIFGNRNAGGTIHYVEVDTDGSVLSQPSSLAYASAKNNLLLNNKNDVLEINWRNDTEGLTHTRFWIPCVGITESENGPLIFGGLAEYGVFDPMLVMLTLDTSDTLETVAVMKLESSHNKVQSVFENSASSECYPSTKAVFDEFEPRPVVIYQYADGMIKITGQSGNMFNAPVWHQVNDISMFRRVKIYLTPSMHSVGLSSNNITSAIMVEVALHDEAATSTVNGYYTGGNITICVNNDNRLFSAGVLIKKETSNDTVSYSVALKTVSLYGSSSTDIYDSYVYKVEGCY